MTEFSVHAFFKLDPNAEDSSQTLQQNSSTDQEFHELRGFDRLHRMNFTNEQISVIRHNFHAMTHTLDSAEDAQLDLEEEWFATLFNQPDYLAILQQSNDENQGTIANIPEDNTNQEAQVNANDTNQQNPNNNTTENPLADQNDPSVYDELDPEILDHIWLTFAFGLVSGMVFGLISILVALISFRKPPFLAGLIGLS